MTNRNNCQHGSRNKNKKSKKEKVTINGVSYYRRKGKSEVNADTYCAYTGVVTFAMGIIPFIVALIVEASTGSTLYGLFWFFFLYIGLTWITLSIIPFLISLIDLYVIIKLYRLEHPRKRKRKSKRK